jgi:hypothetical protein
VELKVPVRDERRKSRSKSLTLDFLPMQERPSVKKLLAYEKEVNEGFAKTENGSLNFPSI